MKPVQDRTLRAQISDHVLDMITAGHVQPGERLTEMSLTAQLQCSRAPLREALRDLVDRGILISQPYRGLYVRAATRRDASELFSMVETLDGFATRLAWPHRDTLKLKELEHRYDALSSAQVKGDRPHTLACDIAFHSWMHETADHAILQAQWRRLVPLLEIYLSLHHRAHGSHGGFRPMTGSYLKLASGDDMEAMIAHLSDYHATRRDAVLDVLTRG